MTSAFNARTQLLQHLVPRASSGVWSPSNVLIRVQSAIMTETVVMVPTKQMHFVNHINGKLLFPPSKFQISICDISLLLLFLIDYILTVLEACIRN